MVKVMMVVVRMKVMEGRSNRKRGQGRMMAIKVVAIVDDGRRW